MTGVEVKSGTFEGDDGNEMTVDGVKYPITIPVANWIRDKKYQPGLAVTFEIKEQNGRRVVAKVYPSKTQPATQEAKPQPDPDLERKLKENGFGTSPTEPAPQHKEVTPARAPDELFSDGEVAAMKAKAAAAQAAKAPEVSGIEKIVADTKARNAAAEEPRSCTSPEVLPAAIVPSHPVPVVAKTYSADEMMLLRNVIAKGCTEPEFKLLMYMASTYGLDPLLKQIWAVKRNDNSPALIFAGRDGMLAIAHRSGAFDGMQSGVEYEGEGANRKPKSAWCEVWRKDMSHSFKTEVPFSEYNTGFSVWKTNPSAMILKVAESVCLRKAFSVSGLYCPEEIDTEAK